MRERQNVQSRPSSTRPKLTAYRLFVLRALGHALGATLIGASGRHAEKIFTFIGNGSRVASRRGPRSERRRDCLSLPSDLFWLIVLPLFSCSTLRPPGIQTDMCTKDVICLLTYGLFHLRRRPASRTPTQRCSRRLCHFENPGLKPCTRSGSSWGRRGYCGAMME